MFEKGKTSNFVSTDATMRRKQKPMSARVATNFVKLEKKICMQTVKKRNKFIFPQNIFILMF